MEMDSQENQDSPLEQELEKQTSETDVIHLHEPVQGMVMGEGNVVHINIYNPQQKDFFISYDRADKNWAEWIAWQLESAGYSVVLQTWDFRPGSNFVLSMDKTIREAKRTIAVISPDYLNAFYVEPEWAAAFVQDPTGERGTLLPIRVRKCELTGLFASIVYLDLVGLDEAKARDSLILGVSSTLNPRTRRKPSSAPAFPTSIKQYKYDVAISYAGEDREYAEALAEALRNRDVRVFYDKYEKSSLWGKELYAHLSDIYQNKARYSVLFLSKYYAAKVWTNREREAALARAFGENYRRDDSSFEDEPDTNILPVRLDNTEIPGISPTIAYLSWPPETAETIAEIIDAKLAKGSHLLKNTATETDAYPFSQVSTTDTSTEPRVPWSKDREIEEIPPGFKLHTLFSGHKEEIKQIVWSPNGLMIATPSSDVTIRIWDLKSKKLHQVLKGSLAYCVAWSPNSAQIASGNHDCTVQVWDAATGEHLLTYDGHSGYVTAVAWSPDGTRLASGSSDKTVQVWDAATGEHLLTYDGHSGYVTAVAWSPDGWTLASSSGDNTVRLWDMRDERQQSILEGHTSAVICISFSSGGHLLASKSNDGIIRLWRSDTWERVAILNEASSGRGNAGMAFHPKAPILATLGDWDKAIRIWDLDITAILTNALAVSSIDYKNAKIVLVGDTGVGKSGLSLVLTGKRFAPTDSTHGRHVWVFDNEDIELSDGRREIREVFLWDLAGQPGYRLIHQFHLFK
jgi:WD40 repeat protein